MSPITPQVEFVVGVLKDHERQLFSLINAAMNRPLNKYIGKDGQVDLALLSQQLAERSTLLLSLTNQLGRLQQSLFAVAAQGLSADYGEMLNDLSESMTDFEHRLDTFNDRALSKLPVHPDSNDSKSAATANAEDNAANTDTNELELDFELQIDVPADGSQPTADVQLEPT